MRVFWIVVGVLAVVAAAVVFATGGDGDNSNNGNQPGTTSANMGQQAPSALPQNVDGPRQVAAGGRSAADPDATALVDDLIESSSTQEAGGSIDAALTDGTGSRAPAYTDADLPAFDPSKPVDGKYIVAGAGTAAEPFEITWDLLLLASQTYQPRYGKSDIPPQVQAIDGKHIKIAGYFAFPLASTDARELLFMLNMWDGCCIGMPPSPYDAIEVRLSQPMAGGGKQWVNYGTLSGIIKVDPYVHEGWLLGMYLMEDGAVDVGM